MKSLSKAGTTRLIKVAESLVKILYDEKKVLSVEACRTLGVKLKELLDENEAEDFLE